MAPEELVDAVVRDYSKQEMERVREFGVDSLYMQLQALWEGDRRTQIVTPTTVMACLPLECGEDEEAWLRFSWVINAEGDGLERVDTDIRWPKAPVLQKMPEYTLHDLAIEYQGLLQQLLNAKQKNRLNTRLKREQLHSAIATAYRPFLLDMDEANHRFIGFYIHVSTADDMLGAAVVNVHLHDYPAKAPAIVMCSPLFFQNAHSPHPAYRAFELGWNPAMGPDEIVTKLRVGLLDQIVAFQSFLVAESHRSVS
ncbi:hypothetical protein HDU91_005122 [Kappamyces sp. JEL0680]|nr:hypothetical protein HDU91_005122 [Kappamyces sp. JEL0680]